MVAQGYFILYKGEMLVCSPYTLREMDCRMVSVTTWLFIARRSWKIKVYFEIGALLSLRLWNFDWPTSCEASSAPGRTT